MKVRESFVSNSSTSSFVCSGEGARVAKIIIEDLCGHDLTEKEKEYFAKKWADLIQNVDTDWSSDD